MPNPNLPKEMPAHIIDAEKRRKEQLERERRERERKRPSVEIPIPPPAPEKTPDKKSGGGTVIIINPDGSESRG